MPLIIFALFLHSCLPTFVPSANPSFLFHPFCSSRKQRGKRISIPRVYRRHSFPFLLNSVLPFLLQTGPPIPASNPIFSCHSIVENHPLSIPPFSLLNSISYVFSFLPAKLHKSIISVSFVQEMTGEITKWQSLERARLDTIHAQLILFIRSLDCGSPYK